ncbi:MAG: exopolysaccharide biosynthesis polyprenyl glycosylphosphotransferase [Oscillospiraceae bacterium]|nr:exopolysaccharide biosynthesis polyprenyl glycosylphosphotransferase [Oscillospiraceae bacterium]
MGMKHDLLVRIVKSLNIIAVTIPFFCCCFVYYMPKLYSDNFYQIENIIIIILFIILYAVFSRIYDAFHLSLQRISELTYSQMLAAFFADSIMGVIFSLLRHELIAVLPLFLCFLAQAAFSALWSLLAHRWYFRTFPPLRTVIIYNQKEKMEDLISAYGMEIKFNVVKTCSVQECLETQLSVIDDTIQTVFIYDIHSHERNKILKYCLAHHIIAYVIPSTGDLIMSSARTMHMFHLPMLRVERCRPVPEYMILKRLFDLLVSGTALLLLSPLMLLIALAVKSDGGAVFYQQTRLTRNGKTFRILKFRSMCPDAEADGIPRLSAGEQDDRITKTGKFLRRFRLDELPQLINILKGDMSVVGPRPERPEIAREYEKQLPDFRLRLQVKAGLTGYAQVYGKYNSSPYDKLQMDLMYIAHPSMIQDIKICFATVKTLFMPESTEGIPEHAVNAAPEDSGKNQNNIS